MTNTSPFCISNSTGLNNGTAVTTVTAGLPTPVASPGGAMIATVATLNNAVHATATPGWTKKDQQNVGAGFTASIWIGAPGSAAPVFTWTGAANAAAFTAAFGSPDSAVDLVLGTPNVSTGTTFPITSTSITSTRDGSTALLFRAIADTFVNSGTTGWTQANSNTAAGIGLITQFKTLPLTGATSGNTSDSHGGTGSAWVQWQVELKTVAPTAGLQVSALETIAWAQPPAGLAASSFETIAWVRGNAHKVAGFRREVLRNATPPVRAGRALREVFHAGSGGLKQGRIFREVLRSRNSGTAIGQINIDGIAREVLYRSTAKIRGGFTFREVLRSGNSISPDDGFITIIW